MSSVVTEAESPRTLNLTNGKTCTFLSNQSTTEEQIPVIDISRMYSNKLEDRQAVADEIRHAAHGIGFFSIINHVGQHLPQTRIPSSSHFF